MWGVRPSSLLGISDDDYLAYCVDEACGEWGSFVRHKLEQVEGKNEKSTEGQRQLLLKKLLEGSAAEQFAAPVVTRED